MVEAAVVVGFAEVSGAEVTFLELVMVDEYDVIVVVALARYSVRVIVVVT